MGGLAGLCRCFGDQQGLLRGFHRGDERIEIAEAAGFRRELIDLVLDVGNVLIELGQTVAVGADVVLELVALGGKIGQRGGEFGEGPLGGSKRRLGFGDAFVSAAALLDARPDFVLEHAVLGFEARERHVRVRQLALLALDVGGELREAPVEFGDALLGARFLAIEHFARAGQPLQTGGGTGFGFAQAGQFGGADRLDAGGLRLLAGPFGLLADIEVMGLARVGDIGVGL